MKTIRKMDEQFIAINTNEGMLLAHINCFNPLITRLKNRMRSSKIECRLSEFVSTYCSNLERVIMEEGICSIADDWLCSTCRKVRPSNELVILSQVTMDYSSF